jgi:hypothetical protein
MPVASALDANAQLWVFRTLLPAQMSEVVF